MVFGQKRSVLFLDFLGTPGILIRRSRGPKDDEVVTFIVRRAYDLKRMWYFQVKS